MKRLLIAVLLLCTTSVYAQNTTVTATNFVDGGANKIQSGRITMLPTDINGNPINASLGASPGLMLPRASVCLIVNGAITTTPTGGVCTVLDTSLTNSAHFCYRTTVIDTVTQWTAPVMPCVQPTGSTWTFDTYVPPAAPTAQVVAGPTGPQGPVGPAGSGLIGLSGDGTGNIAITKQLTASTVAAPTAVFGEAYGSNLPTGFNTIAALGDSLTAGNEDGTGISYPSTLSTLTGQTVYNLGIGGQTSSQIAVRVNAYAGTAKQIVASAFTIPTTGTVNITFPTGFEPCTAQGSAPITISGVSGRCAYSGGNYIFTPTSYPSSPVSVASGTAWTSIVGNELNGTVVIWAGRNGSAATSSVLADVAAIVTAVQQHTASYLVMSDPNGDYPSEWGWIPSQNATLSALYSPGNHYLDIRTIMVGMYNPANPADVIDYANNVWPESLRASDNSGTITAAITDPASCAFTTSTALGAGSIVLIGAEKIFILGGSSGAYSCTRGYASTTATTYATATAYTSVDALHLGQNADSPANPNCTNGYICVANQVQAWLNSTSGATSPLVPMNTLNSLGYVVSGSPVSASSLSIANTIGSLTWDGGSDHALQFTGMSLIYGCAYNDSCQTSLGYTSSSGWGSANFNSWVRAASFSVYSSGYKGTAGMSMGMASIGTPTTKFMITGDGSWDTGGKNLYLGSSGTYGNLGAPGYPLASVNTTSLLVNNITSLIGDKPAFSAGLNTLNVNFGSNGTTLGLAGDNVTLTLTKNFFPTTNATQVLGYAGSEWQALHLSNGVYYWDSTHTYSTLLNAATHTANYVVQLPAASGTTALTNQLPLVGTVTTSASVSDAVTVTSLTSSGHCGAHATNSAAAGLTGVYMGAAGTGTVTLYHSATAGGTFNIICTPN